MAMNCPKCNQPLENGALYCPACGDRFASTAQKARVKYVLNNVRSIPAYKTKSPLFIISSICFTLLFLIQLIPWLSDVFDQITDLPDSMLLLMISMTVGALPVLFMLLSVIGMWKSVAAKNGTDASGALSMASTYDAYCSVIATLFIVLFAISAGIDILFIFAQQGENMFDSSENFIMLSSSLGVVVFIFGTIITLTAMIKNIFSNRRSFFRSLSYASDTGKYSRESAPVVGSYILGGFLILVALFAVIATGALADLIVELSDTIGLSDAAEMLDISAPTFISTMFYALVGTLALQASLSGVYYILSAVWMGLVHQAQLAGVKAVNKETSTLARIDEATQSLIAQREAEIRRAREAALRAQEQQKKEAEEAAKRAQAAAQEQQQRMMLQMMQMMQANGMNIANMTQNAAAAAVAAATAANAATTATEPTSAPAPAPAPAPAVEPAPVVEAAPTVEAAPAEEPTPAPEQPTPPTPAE